MNRFGYPRIKRYLAVLSIIVSPHLLYDEQEPGGSNNPSSLIGGLKFIL
jgi:hypothetical protein